MKILAIFALLAAAFMLISWGCWRGFKAIHRRGRPAFASIIIGSSLFWFVLPLIRTHRLTPEFRIFRSVLAPPWFYWICISLAYGSLLVILLVLWSLTYRRLGISFGRFGRPFSYLFLVAMTLVTVIGVFQALVPLRVTRVAVTIPNLPPALEGRRLALMSDIHVGLFTRPSRLRTISETINSLEPDNLFICGDLLDDDPVNVQKLLDGLAHIAPEIPIMAVLGNHEMYGDPAAVRQALEGTRVELLVNESRGVLVDDAILWIAGISDFAGSAEWAPDLETTLRGRPSGSLTILLSHQPRVFQSAVENNVDLVLAGHTHGGQFGFRSLGWSLAGVFLPRDMGLWKEADTQMFITTGAGHWLVPVRFGMSPEIVLIELRGR